MAAINDIKFYDSTNTLIETLEILPSAFTNIAPAYSTSSTYALGDLVTYDLKIYKCTTPITTAEAWTAAHWTQVDMTDVLSNLRNDIGGGETVLIATDSDPYAGYWSRNANTGIMSLVSSSTYYTLENPIDISSLKVGTSVSIMSSVTGNYGAYIFDANNNCLEYVNGSNASEKGYVTGAAPQLITMTVPASAKYIVSDIRTTQYTNMSIFNVTGIVKSSIDVVNDLAIKNRNNIQTVINAVSENNIYIYPYLEIGRLSIYTDVSNPWVYSDYNDAIRTKEGFTIHLYPGDTVGLTDYYGNCYFALGWKKRNNTYSRALANTSDYTVIDEGDYVITVYQTPKVLYSDVYPIASRVFVKRAAVKSVKPYDRIEKYPLKGIAHRGYTYEGAPENTVHSFRAAKTNGFHYVETDIAFTSDNVAVLLHDPTINRVARNQDGSELTDTINISDITYAQALQYDFGIWKGSQYAGTKIMTVEELLIFSRANDMFPYFEIKSVTGATDENFTAIVDLMNKYNMIDSCAFISFSQAHLYKITHISDRVKIGRTYSTGEFDDTIKGDLLLLQTPYNRVVFICYLDIITANESAVIQFCKTNNIALAIAMTNDADVMKNANNYITECVSDRYNFEKVISDREMGITS